MNLDITVVSYGFGAPLEDRFLIRRGQWVPVLVKLTLHSGSPMEVELHCESRDLDGDYVSFVKKNVTLTPGAENQKRVWLYAIAPSIAMPTPPVVSVHDIRGGTIARAAVTSYSDISNNMYCILDVSARPVTRIRAMESAAVTSDEDYLGKSRSFMRPVIVARMPSNDLPDRWFGLESIDALIWDEPDLSDVGKFSNAQIEAIRQWVAHGGTLIVGLGETWPTVRKTPLAEILPVRGDGPPVTVTRLPNFFSRFTGGTIREFKTPVSVAVVENRNGLPVLFDRADGTTDISLIVEGPYGSGRVVCVAAPLRALLETATGDLLIRQLLDLQRIAPELVSSEANRVAFALSGMTSLYDLLTQRRIDFQLEGARLDLAAIAFVLAYGVAATIGSWWWLRRVRLTSLSWSVFCGFAVVASAMSLLFVFLARGGTRVESVQIVDLHAGASEARAACWFGLRAGNAPAQDVSLPGDQSYLRPLSRGSSNAQYAAPKRYEAWVDEARLANVPLRAAAKQFEGEWSGALTGSIRAQITVDRGTGQIEPASWIKNDLDVDLEGGYLLYLDPRSDAIRVFAAGTDYRNRQVLPARNILAVQIAPLKAGAQVAGLNADRYREIRTERLRWDQNQATAKGPMPDLDTLFTAQLASIGAVSGAGSIFRFATDPAWNAAFLMSTRNLYAHVTESDSEAIGLPITTSGLTDCDVSHWFTHGYGALIVWSREAGPAPLLADDRPLRARRGFTVYRVRLPIQMVGSRSTTGGAE